MSFFYSNKTKGFYDTSAANYILPEDAVELTEPEYKALLFGLNTGKEIIIVNGQFELQTRKTTWDSIRNRRNQLLADSDRTQLSDYSGEKEAWSAYRQALREIPQTYSDPDDVVWPTPPA